MLPHPTSRRTHIDEDELLACVYEEATISNLKQVRILVQCLENSIHRRRRSSASADRIRPSIVIAPSLRDPDFQSVEAGA